MQPKTRAGWRAKATRGGRGVTLVELAIALALAATLVVIALPSFADWIAEVEVMNEARHLAAAMGVARSEAIKRGDRVSLCKSRDRLQCDVGASWGDGFIVYVDADHDGNVDSGVEPILRIAEAAPSGISVSGNRPVADYVSFTPLGTARLLSGALQMGTITVCRSGRRGADVILVQTGRVRIAKTAARCP
jgi:type IV fimbrial biogenesis protein FimT